MYFQNESYKVEKTHVVNSYGGTDLYYTVYVKIPDNEIDIVDNKELFSVKAKKENINQLLDYVSTINSKVLFSIGFIQYKDIINSKINNAVFV